MQLNSKRAMKWLFYPRSQEDEVTVNVHVQVEDFSLDAAYTAIRARDGAAIGAIAAFVGLVRDVNKKAGDGSAVARLTLEHYPGMTETSIEKIAQQASARWKTLSIDIYHRVGDLAPTDQIVMVLVSSGHREDAFAAAEFVMDYLKTEAVFWKKETSENGTRWIESTSGDRERALGWRRS